MTTAPHLFTLNLNIDTDLFHDALVFDFSGKSVNLGLSLIKFRLHKFMEGWILLAIFHHRLNFGNIIIVFGLSIYGAIRSCSILKSWREHNVPMRGHKHWHSKMIFIGCDISMAEYTWNEFLSTWNKDWIKWSIRTKLSDGSCLANSWVHHQFWISFQSNGIILWFLISMHFSWVNWLVHWIEHHHSVTHARINAFETNVKVSMKFEITHVRLA